MRPMLLATDGSASAATATEQAIELVVQSARCSVLVVPAAAAQETEAKSGNTNV
jgi:hypothetical protein